MNDIHDFIIDFKQKDGRGIYNPITKKLMFVPKGEKLSITDDFYKKYDGSIDSRVIWNSLKNIYRYSNQLATINLHTNFDCNLNCVYCYQTGNTDRALKMDQTTADQFLVFFQKLYENSHFNHLDLCYIGGEPFLNTKIISYLNEKIQDIASNAFKVFTSIVTNGTLLSIEKNIDFLKAMNFDNIMITLDGLPDYHNQMRRGIEDSFRKILDGIKFAQERGAFNFVINCNLTSKNADHAEKLLKLLLENKIYYPLVFSLVFENKKGRLKELLPPNDLWYKAHTIAKTLGYEFEPFYRNSYITCNYFKENSFNVSPDGKLYNCLSGVGMEAYYISDLKEYDTYRYYSRKSQFMLEDNHADCDTTCDLYSICDGGCMFRKKTSGFNCERQHLLNNEIELLKDLIPYE